MGQVDFEREAVHIAWVRVRVTVTVTVTGMATVAVRVTERVTGKGYREHWGYG